MVASVVAELQLVGAASEGEAEQLVAEADPEDGNVGRVAPTEQRLELVYDALYGRWISRAVAEEHTIRLELEHLGDGRRRRNDRGANPLIAQHP